jgi:hypothetical protein
VRVRAPGTLFVELSCKILLCHDIGTLETLLTGCHTFRPVPLWPFCPHLPFFWQPEANSITHKVSRERGRTTMAQQSDDGEDTFVGESNSFLDPSVSTAGAEPGSPLL